MLKVNQFSKLLTSKNPLKTCVSRIFWLDGKINTSGSLVNFGVPRNFYSSDKKDSKKVCDKKDDVAQKKSLIQSHPSPPTTSEVGCESSGVKLRECKPIDINPCKPPPKGFPSKIPSLHDCPTKNIMSELPEPKCGWDDHDQKNRSRYKKILLLGLLVTAITVGGAWYVGFLDYHEKKEPVKVKREQSTKRKPQKIPASSAEIPSNVPYLLIGGGTASFSAFRAIKSSDPTAKVLVVTNESFFPYMRPPLSKEIWFNDDKEAVRKFIFKQWNGSERSLFYEPDDFYIDCKQLMSSTNGGVAVARGWTISHIDVFEKIAYLEDGKTISYDKCLVATGATPRLSPIFEVAYADPAMVENIKLYRNVYDFEDVNKAFEESKSIAIIGGGFLGSELACALARKDKAKSKMIYQLFPEGGNMGKILPEYLSFWTTDKVRGEGVSVLSNTEVVAIKREKKGLELTLNNGKKLMADNVIVTMGVEPNTQLAEKSDLEVDPDLGGFLVNTELQARTDLYIAGDCACFYDPRLGRRRIEHHDHAVVSGRLAGENMTGARKPYLHQSMFWSDLGPDVGYEAIGIVDAQLPTVGVFAKATDKDSPKAVVTATDEGIRSATEEIPQVCEKYLTKDQLEEQQNSRKMKSVPNHEAGEDYGKGIIFYLRNDIVVGIVLWNVFNRMSIARQVLKDQKSYEDLNEVAKLFNIHEG